MILNISHILPLKYRGLKRWGNDYMTCYKGDINGVKRWKNYRTIVSRDLTQYIQFLAGKCVYIKKYL